MDLELYKLFLSHEIFSMIVGFLIILAILAIFCEIFRPRKSLSYRKLLVDMYVAGKIRKFAEKDGINFADEEENFHKWCKKERLMDLTLDGAIEESLQEKIMEVSKETQKIKKEK